MRLSQVFKESTVLALSEGVLCCQQVLSLTMHDGNKPSARVLCNGKTLAFQAKDTGSIPVTRSTPDEFRA